MHPRCSPSHEPRGDQPPATRFTRGRLPSPLKHGFAKNVSAHSSGASATNCTADVMEVDVTSVTDVQTHRADPKSHSPGQNDIKGHGGCHKRVKSGSRVSRKRDRKWEGTSGHNSTALLSGGFLELA